MEITITGASGFVGRRLSARLMAAGHRLRLLGRTGRLTPGTESANVRAFVWDPMAGPPPAESLAGCDAVIHLAGEPVAQRWSDEVRHRIRDSRVTGTRNLVAGLRAANPVPETLISASAVGFYGDRPSETLTESSAPGAGFLPDVCREWEREAEAVRDLGVRVAMIRIGLVLGSDGGALEQMLPPFKMGVGGRLGPGTQYTPWIHLDDLCALFEFALDHPLHGPLNGCAPNPVTNAEFTRVLASSLHRPAIFPVPRFAINLLYGEMAQILFNSQRAVPRAAEAAGFRFKYPDLGVALADVLS